MSKKDEPAFPVKWMNARVRDGKLVSEDGLTKRELVAAMAMQGIRSSMGDNTVTEMMRRMAGAEGVSAFTARLAVEDADALLAELEKKK